MIISNFSYSAPNNGFCSAKMKGLRHQCRNSEECEDFMICRENNGTKTILGSLSKDSSKDRLCFCDEENGYMENIIEKHCNGERNFVFGVFLDLEKSVKLIESF